ncbi:MAG: SRPBCC family protein, partial [Chthoniobacterales bacterium]
MLLQKTFHMSQSLDECKSRLASIQSYRRQLKMVTKATVTSSKTLALGLRGPLGFEAETVVTALDSDSPDQMAFESWGGNIDLMGLIEFEEVRPDCTEVTIAVHYDIKNKVYAWFDQKFGFMDAFLTSELRSLRSHFEGIAAPVLEDEVVYTGMFEPVSA